MSGTQDQSDPQAASAYAASEASKDDGSPSLTSTLTILQRTQLIQLLAAITALQRESITSAFSATATLSPELAKDLQGADGTAKDSLELNPNIDPGKADVEYFEKQRKALKEREEELKKEDVIKLKGAVLEWFDDWRTEMVGRVGEVVKLKKEARKAMGEEAETKTPMNVSAEKSKQGTGHNEDRKINPEKRSENAEENAEQAEEELKKLYPPVETPLKELAREKRVLVVHSMLLILLSLEHYSAPSRVLLLYICTSLDIPMKALDEDEAKTSTGLIEGAKQLSGKAEADKAAQENQSSRRWKVGLATAAGAALIGVTGGLAAPLVAAGVGSVMGGLGLGATAAAGYLGSLAGSTVLVGGLFGAYGGRMTGQMMDSYAKEVSDFAFLPVHNAAAAEQQAKSEQESTSGRPQLNRHESQQKEEAIGISNAESRRLRVTVGISGWLTNEDEVVLPWKVLGESSEAFALRFELEALMNLGHAMTSMVRSAAWGYAKSTIISSTILASLASAVAWPIGLMKVARVVDNPFSVAKARADKAGTVLADALINRAQGERPVNLVGYSLGARVVYSCLKTLAERKAFGLIDSAVLIGAPIPSTALEWRAMRSVVAGRLVNTYSENDYVLGFLYRTSSVQYGVTGLQRIDGVAGIENVDVSDTISGHLRYRYLVGSILQQIGWEDLNEKGLRREREALEAMEEEQRQKSLKDKGKEAGMMVAGWEKTGQKTADPEKDGKGSEDAEQMEKEVKEKTNESMLQRGARFLSLSGTQEKPKTVENTGTAGQPGKQNAPQQQKGSSYLPDMSNVSMPKMPNVSMPKVSAPSWLGGKSDKPAGSEQK